MEHLDQAEVRMSQIDKEKRGRRQALKRLRAARREKITAASARVKEQQKAVRAIKDALQQGNGETVPRLAETLGMPTAEVFWYIAALKKYGYVAEGEQDGGYYRYVLAETAQSSATS
jgi:hypothetical protein